MIDILTLNYNDSLTTIEFVNSIVSYRCINKVLIVDNCSTDNSFESLKQIESDKIIVISSKKNGGYGAGNNFGIRYLYDNFNSKYILLANPDVVVKESVLKRMFFFLKENEDYAIVAPMMTDLNGRVQYNTAFKIPNIWHFLMSFEMFFSKLFNPFKYNDSYLNRKPFVDVCAVSGSLFMMNAEKMIEYGMFDENLFLYCEEHVLGTKLSKSNIKTALLTEEKFIHNHSISISKSFKSITSRNRLRNESRYYVLKEYYKANSIILLLARLLSKVNTVESFFIDFFKR